LRPVFAFAMRQPAIRATTLMYMIANVGEGILLVLVPTIARRELGGGPATYGILLSAFAVSVTVGAFAVGAIDWPWPLGRSIALAQALGGVAILGLIPVTSLATAVAVLVVVGLFVSPLTVWAQTIRMRVTPPELRGRMFGLLRTLMQSTPPLGGIIAGTVLANGGSVGPMVAAVGACFAVPGLVGLASTALDERHTVAPYAARDADPEARAGLVPDRPVPRRDDGGAVAATGDQPRGREGLPVHRGRDRRHGGAER
jgi:MFS family permease